jgi:hypothetical protein
MKILEFKPTNSQIERAKKLSEGFKLNESSVMGGSRNLYAFLGEVVCGDFFEQKGWKLHPEGYEPYNFDIIDNKGNKWDIKTKMTTVKPRGNFNCTIHTYLDQKCDGYIFTRCMKNLSKVWILGWISKEELKKTGTYYKKGDIDDNLVMSREGLGVQINKLNTFAE